jgi:outer membrane protein assembly factor BamB
MNRQFAWALVGILLAGHLGYAQGRRDIYTRPELPSSETLDRLNLTQDWHRFLPRDGYRDALYSMMIGDKQHIVQMRSGEVIALDAASGRLQWQTQVGEPFVSPVGFGANATLVFVAKGARLYAVNKSNGVLAWIYELPTAPAAAPVADDTNLYVPIGNNRMVALELPQPGSSAPPPPSPVVERKPEAPPAPGLQSRFASYYNNRGMSALGSKGQGLESISAVSSGGRRVANIGPLSSARAATGAVEEGPEPRIVWQFQTETRPETRLEQSSILTRDLIFQAGQNGLFFALRRSAPAELYRLQADASVSAALGRYGDIAYVPSQDFHLYALDIETGRVQWRFGVGGPILMKPRISDDDVYVATERNGLYRLDRKTGFQIWRNFDAERFVAMNKKYVYVTDHSGRLLILDRTDGKQQASWDGARLFGVPLSNETNDRIFLCSADGQLLCLHDRDYPTPMSLKSTKEVVSPAPGGAKQAKP